MPGIRQLEAILTTYYNEYPEFQENFYWSSAAGKRRWGLTDFTEDSDYARATKALPRPYIDIDGDGTLDPYAISDWDDDYTGENGNRGKAPRRGTYLRIRAAHMPASGEVIE